MDAKDKFAEDKNASARLDQKGSERVDGTLQGQIDATNPNAVREASRLGGGDTYLVKSDLEDQEQREDLENEDGSISSLANADNPER